MSQETRKVTAEAGLTKVLQNRFAGRTRPAVYLFCKSVVACFFLFPGQASNGREVQAEEQKAKFADRDTEENDPMKIVRIYNNSCASVTDEAGQDMVAIGRGIAFGKKAGDELDGAQVEKLYLLEDTDVSGRLASVLDGIEDADIYLEISEEIFAFLRAEGCQVRESLLLTLTDHIATSVERERQGVILENPLLADIRQLYHHQYQLAKQAAEIIKKHTGVTVSKDEIGFITLHIVSASSDGGFDNLLEITHIIQKILVITEEQFGIQLNENSLRYTLNHVYDRYHKPVFILENSSGFVDKLEEDGTVHDPYRVEFLREHIKTMMQAVKERLVREFFYFCANCTLIFSKTCKS